MPHLAPGCRAARPRRLVPTLLAGCLAVGLASAPTAGQPAAAGADVATATTAATSATYSTSTAYSTGARTKVGSTVFEKPRESTRQAFLRVRRTYGGKLGAVRVFFPGLPAPWSRIRDNYGATPLVVSFRADPGAVLAGRYDRELRSWFRTAPKNRLTRWSYMHEPEDDITGARETRQYRRAWRHIGDLAKSTERRKLRATLILMCWTLERNSGRSWRDYYPGPGTIRILAFDCYNGGHRNDTYRSPRELLRHAAALSRRTGKQWGVAELGSVVVDGDNGRGRAAWLRKSVAYARNHDAAFVTYFDSDVGVDYRLRDRPSKSAWRTLVSSQFG